MTTSRDYPTQTFVRAEASWELSPLPPQDPDRSREIKLSFTAPIREPSARPFKADSLHSLCLSVRLSSSSSFLFDLRRHAVTALNTRFFIVEKKRPTLLCLDSSAHQENFFQCLPPTSLRRLFCTRRYRARSLQEARKKGSVCVPATKSVRDLSRSDRLRCPTAREEERQKETTRPTLRATRGKARRRRTRKKEGEDPREKERRRRRGRLSFLRRLKSSSSSSSFCCSNALPSFFFSFGRRASVRTRHFLCCHSPWNLRHVHSGSGVSLSIFLRSFFCRRIRSCLAESTHREAEEMLPGKQSRLSDLILLLPQTGVRRNPNSLPRSPPSYESLSWA